MSAVEQISQRDEILKHCAQVGRTKKYGNMATLENAAMLIGRMEGVDEVWAEEQLWKAIARNAILSKDNRPALEDAVKRGLAQGRADRRDNVVKLPTPSKGKGLQTIYASSVSLRAISWLWPDRFALGKIALIGGLPDKGKGLISSSIAACVTANQPLPMDEGYTPQGSVIYFSAEDDAEDTIVPRLIAAGANLKKVHLAQAMRQDGQDRTFSMVTDLKALMDKIDEIGDVVLVIIDPISAYLGIGKVNSQSTTDVRGFLKPFSDFAAQKRIAVIGITHSNKKADVHNAMLRLSDSLAYVAASRSAYFVADDPDEEDQRIFAVIKSNLGPSKKALTYRVGVREVGYDHVTKETIHAPHIIWGAKYKEITANEAIAAESGGASGRAQRRQAKDFLSEALEDGPRSANDVMTEALTQDISKATLRRAKEELKVVSKKATADSGWTWELPPSWKGTAVR